jgi:predicted ATP-grasp superfamily ATP-dependent carboligase
VSIVLVGMMELVLDATSMVAFNARQVTIWAHQVATDVPASSKIVRNAHNKNAKYVSKTMAFSLTYALKSGLPDCNFILKKFKSFYLFS